MFSIPSPDGGVSVVDTVNKLKIVFTIGLLGCSGMFEWLLAIVIANHDLSWQMEEDLLL